MEADARKESSDEQNRRMNELGNTIKKTFEEGERRREIDRQITQESIHQMVSGELTMARAVRTQEQENQANQMQTIFQDAKLLFQSEASKLTSQFAHTVLDVRGLKNKVLSMDEDLKATSEVDAFTTGYLNRVAKDYSPPEDVDYKNLITPTNTPVKRRQQMRNVNEESPLLRVAGPEC